MTNSGVRGTVVIGLTNFDTIQVSLSNPKFPNSEIPQTTLEVQALFTGMYFLQYTHILILCFSRYGEQRGTGAGRSRLPHALPPGLPRVAA